MRSSTVYKGIVRDGKIVLQNDETPLTLPEGTPVEIHPMENKQDANEEENWRRQSEESWATIAWGAN